MRPLTSSQPWSTPDGQEFLDELQVYLEAHGQRSDWLFELDDPTWLEEPAPVLSTLREYMTLPDRDLEGELTAQAAERERQVARTPATLAGPPAAPWSSTSTFLLRCSRPVRSSVKSTYDWIIDYWNTN